jgi:hypothetical protein
LLNNFCGFAFIYKYKAQDPDMKRKEMAAQLMTVFRDIPGIEIFIKTD